MPNLKFSVYAAIALVMATLVESRNASGQIPPTYVEPSGFRLTCYAAHQFTGRPVPVAGMNGYAGGYWAFAKYNAAGWPIIIIDVAQLVNYPQIVARFTYYHEWAHHVERTTDEFLATCEGLKAMRRKKHITRRGERILRDVHYSLGRLPEKYGGSGKELWDRTIRCAGSR